MKRFMSLFAVCALSLSVLAGCGSATSEAPATTEGDDATTEVAAVQTATDSVDFNGKTVITSVNVTGGMSVEFTTAGTVYLFEGANDDEAIQIANGFIIDQKEYDENLADYQANDESFSEVGAGFIAENGSRYLYAVGEDVFYMIQVDTYDHPDANCDDIFSRFTVSIEE